MPEKSDEDLILELESLLKQGGRPRVEEKESITLRISAPLARHAKIAFPDERSRIYEEALIRQLRAVGALPPPLDLIKAKAGKHSAHTYFNPDPTDKAPDYVLDNPFEKPKAPKASPTKPKPKK